MSGAHSRDDEDLLGAVLISRDALGLLHEKGAIPLMLELGRITSLLLFDDTSLRYTKIEVQYIFHEIR